MRQYELVIIFEASLDDQAVNEGIKRTTDFMKTQGGSFGKVERWGRRKLAYPVKKKTDGFYVVIEAFGEPDKQAALDRSLFLADDVLRHKILRANPRSAAERTIEAPPNLEDLPPAGRDRGDRPERGERGERGGGRGRDRNDR